MAEAKGRHEWAQTSSLMALIFNRHRGEKEQPRSAADFNPYGGPRAAGQGSGARISGRDANLPLLLKKLLIDDAR
jgi:hypothetical protein